MTESRWDAGDESGTLNSPPELHREPDRGATA